MKTEDIGARALLAELDKVIAELEQSPIVYRGGRHVIRCDGARHYLVADNGHVEVEGRCWCPPRSRVWDWVGYKG